MSGQHTHSHDRPRWTQFALIGAYGVLVLLCWVYRDWLGATTKSLYGVSPIAILVLIGGYRIFYEAISDLLRLKISADLAVAIAAVAALVIGENFAAAEVIFIMLIGGGLEEVAVDRTERSIRRIVEMAPETARVRRDGREEQVPVEQVREGDTVILRPGERVPVDGVVTSGRSSVNEATITGEPMAATKTVGDEVHAGTLSEAGALEIEATRVGDDTTLARIAHLVEEAQERKGVVQRRADRWAVWFVPLVLAIAAATYLITKEPIRSVAVLVVACPCALVLATPTAVVAAIGRLAREGVLIRGGGHLEALASADTVAFDKTGTVTRGEPRIVATVPLGEATAEDLLRYAGSAEQQSEHGLARLIVSQAQEANVPLLPADDFETHTGAGVAATVQGKRVIVGKLDLLRGMKCQGVDGAEEAAGELEARGAMLAFCAVDGEVMGFLAAEDPVREEAAEAIAELGEAGIEDTLILTGDHERAAGAVRRATGIAHQHANLLPHEKAEIIGDLQKEGRGVIAVGDGVNDAPALATASVGVAMGDVATDITADAADVILATADLRRIAGLVRFSRRTMGTIRTNVFWFAILFNAIGVAASARGLIGPIGAAIYHQMASLLVVCNSLRLLTAGRLEERGRIARAADGFAEWLHDFGHRLRGPDWGAWWNWVKANRAPLIRWGAIAAIVLYVASGVYTVGPAEVGVVRRLGARHGPPRLPGLHYRLPRPLERVTRVKRGIVRKVEIGYRSAGTGEEVSGYEWESPHQAGQYVRQPEESLRLTGDENLLDAQVSIHYVVSDPDDYVFHVVDEEQLTRVIGEAAVRSVLGRNTADEVLTDARLEIEGEIAKVAGSLFDRYESGLKVVDARLLDVHPPIQVVPAFRQVASAMEEKRTLIDQAWAYSNEQLPKAKGRAAAMRLEGQAWAAGRKNRAAGDAERFRQVEQAHRGAPQVVEVRMHLEALERALADREKLILSGRHGGRRQIWLLDSRGARLQGGPPPLQQPQAPAYPEGDVFGEPEEPAALPRTEETGVPEDGSTPPSEEPAGDDNERDE